ncbi:MAG: DUF47 domain-containing protein [Chitinophagaceae bacterium]
MKSNFFAKIFLPKDSIFFDLFDESTKNMCAIAARLIELVHEPDIERRKALKELMHNIEHQNDRVTHSIFKSLSKTFITPFDREDIHHLTLALDDVVDFIYTSSKNILLYNVDPTKDKTIHRMSELIQNSVFQLQKAIKYLRNRKNYDAIDNVLVEINSIENMADTIYDNAINKLFNEEKKDPVEIIKAKNIYNVLELTTDKCEDVCNVIESILIKYA